MQKLQALAGCVGSIGSQLHETCWNDRLDGAQPDLNHHDLAPMGPQKGSTCSSRWSGWRLVKGLQAFTTLCVPSPCLVDTMPVLPRSQMALRKSFITLDSGILKSQVKACKIRCCALQVDKLLTDREAPMGAQTWCRYALHISHKQACAFENEKAAACFLLFASIVKRQYRMQCCSSAHQSSHCSCRVIIHCLFLGKPPALGCEARHIQASLSTVLSLTAFADPIGVQLLQLQLGP